MMASYGTALSENVFRRSGVARKVARFFSFIVGGKMIYRHLLHTGKIKSLKFDFR